MDAKLGARYGTWLAALADRNSVADYSFDLAARRTPRLVGAAEARSANRDNKRAAGDCKVARFIMFALTIRGVPLRSRFSCLEPQRCCGVLC